MSVAAIASSIHDLATIPLSELVAGAALQTRTDRKYIVGAETVDELISRLSGGLRALAIDDRRVFSYESVYFDTPDLRCYHDAARRRPRRFKVRTRSTCGPSGSASTAPRSPPCTPSCPLIRGTGRWLVWPRTAPPHDAGPTL